MTINLDKLIRLAVMRRNADLDNIVIDVALAKSRYEEIQVPPARRSQKNVEKRKAKAKLIQEIIKMRKFLSGRHDMKDVYLETIAVREELGKHKEK